MNTIVKGWKRLRGMTEGRKSRLRIALELLAWTLRKGEIPRHYFEYGFHRENKSSRHYMAVPRFKKLNYRLNTLVGIGRQAVGDLESDIHYLAVVRDKLVFNEYLRGLRFPTPVNLCLLGRSDLVWLDSGRSEPLERIVDHDLSGFLKNVLGEAGEEVARLRSGGGRLFLNERETDLAGLRSFIRPQAILQQAIEQHPEMNRLHAGAVNTLRLVTLNTGGDVALLSAVLRVGCGAGFTDNISRGGIAVTVRGADGELAERGTVFYPEVRPVTAHPDSGVAFAGFRIPFYARAREMALLLHRYLYGLFSVGWDVAITPAGPLIIEGNDNWSMPGHQIMEGRGLQAEYLRHAAAFRRWHRPGGGTR